MASPEISDADRFRMTTIILTLASDAARHLLEAMMTTSEYEKTFVERIHDQGLAEGEAKGKAEAVLKLLDARHLVPSAEQRQRVTSCTDALQLDRWFDRAVTAGTAAEVFADERIAYRLVARALDMPTRFSFTRHLLPAVYPGLMGEQQEVIEELPPPACCRHSLGVRVRDEAVARELLRGRRSRPRLARPHPVHSVPRPPGPGLHLSRYAVPTDDGGLDLDVLYAELSERDLATLPRVAPGLVIRRDLRGSAGWSYRRHWFLIASAEFGRIDTLPWLEKSVTKQLVAAQPGPDHRQPSLFEDLLTDGVVPDDLMPEGAPLGASLPARIDPLLLAADRQLKLPSFIVAHSLEADTGEIELAFGRPWLNLRGGSAWHWREDLLTCRFPPSGAPRSRPRPGSTNCRQYPTRPCACASSTAVAVRARTRRRTGVTPTDRPRAADVAAFFDGARLTLGRQLAGLRKSDLAQYLEMSPTAVAAWEWGAKPRPPSRSPGSRSAWAWTRASSRCAPTTWPRCRPPRTSGRSARPRSWPGTRRSPTVSSRSTSPPAWRSTSNAPTRTCRASRCRSTPTPQTTAAPERAARYVRDQWAMTAAGAAPGPATGEPRRAHRLQPAPGRQRRRLLVRQPAPPGRGAQPGQA